MDKKSMIKTVRHYTKGKLPEGYEWGVISSHNSVDRIEDPEDFIVTVSLVKTDG